MYFALSPWLIKVPKLVQSQPAISFLFKNFLISISRYTTLNDSKKYIKINEVISSAVLWAAALARYRENPESIGLPLVSKRLTAKTQHQKNLRSISAKLTSAASLQPKCWFGSYYSKNTCILPSMVKSEISFIASIHFDIKLNRNAHLQVREIGLYGI